MDKTIGTPSETLAPHTGCTGALPVMEQFYTLQGEGRYSGQAAYFIRLAGCHVRCPWCDVKDSWTVRSDQFRRVEIIVQDIPPHVRIAVITGGEPLLHNLSGLTDALKERGIRTHLETSGSRPLSGRWDWVCVSPKTAAPPLDETLALADELKVVVCGPDDFHRAERYARKTKAGCVLSLQPEWDTREQVMPLIIDYVQQHPDWRLSLQAHKYIDIR